jgi:PKD repeat protein
MKFQNIILTGILIALLVFTVSAAPETLSVSGDTVYIYNTSGADTWTVPSGVPHIWYQVIGGGAQGGSAAASCDGGGGGAGGMLINATGFYSVLPGDTWNVYTGIGGTGATSSSQHGVNGTGSYMSNASVNISSKGGGGGGSDTGTIYNGFPGGSGGGAGDNGASGGSGTAGQGNNGAAGSATSGGGGGGAGGAGATSGTGGTTKVGTITGSSVNNAGGGGGGKTTTNGVNSTTVGGGGGGKANSAAAGFAGKKGAVYIRWTPSASSPMPVSFSSNVTTIVIPPGGVGLTDSSGWPDVNYWNITWGDSTFSNLTSIPSGYGHGYPRGGIYSITLSLANGTQTNSSTLTDYISAYNLTTADFTRSPASGVFPLTVIMNSTGYNNTWNNWSFGNGDWFNGSTITAKNASDVYYTGKVYTITHYTSDQGFGTDSHTDTITVYNQTTSSFSSNVTSGIFPFAVAFTGVAGNTSPTPGYYWMFGDGGTDTVLSPTHTYTGAGLFSVNFSVSNGQFTNWTNISQMITSSSTPLPIVQFTQDSAGGMEPSLNTPITVHFTDTSTGVIVSRSWLASNTTPGNNTPFEFSTDVNPSFAFPIGTWDVRLNATNTGGTNQTASGLHWVNVTPYAATPVADFSATPLFGNASLDVTFTDLSTNTPSTWNWSYKNTTQDWTVFNQTSAPWFSFPKGIYSINLTVSNSLGANTKTKLAYIESGASIAGAVCDTTTVSGDVAEYAAPALMVGFGLGIILWRKKK